MELSGNAGKGNAFTEINIGHVENVNQGVKSITQYTRYWNGEKEVITEMRGDNALVVHSNNWGTYISETLILDGGVAFCHLDLPGRNDPLVHRKRAWLHDLSVLPGSRKRGYGKRLVEICRQRAKADGRQWLSLWVEPGTWMEEWYQRLGFELDKHFRRGDGTNVYNLRLD